MYICTYIYTHFVGVDVVKRPKPVPTLCHACKVDIDTHTITRSSVRLQIDLLAGLFATGLLQIDLLALVISILQTISLL